MKRYCKIEGCDRVHSSRGVCHYHRTRWSRGDKSIELDPPTYIQWGDSCLLEGCDRVGKITKGYCDAHYRQYLKHGKPISVEIATPNRPKGTLEERFWASLSKSDDPTACWEWMGYKNVRGYGTIGNNRKNKLAHRLSYELHHGVQLNSHQPVHHTCANSGCVNPAHLQRVTPQENTAEMRERKNYESRIKYLEELLILHGIEYKE